MTKNKDSFSLCEGKVIEDITKGGRRCRPPGCRCLRVNMEGSSSGVCINLYDDDYPGVSVVIDSDSYSAQEILENLRGLISKVEGGWNNFSERYDKFISNVGDVPLEERE